MVDIIGNFAEAWRHAGEAPAANITLNASKGRPFVGESVTLTWFTEIFSQPVTLYRNDQVLLSNQINEGSAVIQITTLDRLNLHLECGNQVAHCTIEPQVRVPQITRFQVSDKLLLGETLTIDYTVSHCEAVTVEVLKDQACVQKWHSQSSRAALSTSLVTADTYTVRLTARSADSEFSARAITSQVRTVTVRHPPAVIRSFSVDQQRAVIGVTAAEIQWSVDNATKVWLERGSGHQLVLRHCGRHFLDPTMKAGRFRYTLWAENPAGERQSKSISVSWQFPQLTIQFRTSARQVYYGDRHELTWSIEGARSVQLSCQTAKKFNQNYQELSSTKSGKLKIKLESNTKYRLSILAMNGKRHERILTVGVTLMPARAVVEDAISRPSLNDYSPRDHTPLPITSMQDWLR